MVIKFIIPGKAKEEYLLLGYEEYLKRLSKFAKTSLLTIKEEKLSDKPSENEIKNALDKEADKMLSLLKEEDIVFLLDVHAPLIDSSTLAKKIKEYNSRSGNFVFVLGSSYGLSSKIRERANYSFSLSKMTFTHYLALLITLEQVYRAMKINSNQVYDK